jgi:hypothetical protein
MIPNRPNPALCRERAAIYARHAEETASAEIVAELRYLQLMWTVIARVTDVIEGNESNFPLSEPPYLSPD